MMCITVISYTNGNEKDFLRSIKRKYGNVPSPILFPKTLIPGKERLPALTSSAMTETWTSCFVGILDKLAESLAVYEAEPSEDADQIMCCLLTVLFLSIRFFPMDSLWMFLPQRLCFMLDSLVKQMGESIIATSEMRCARRYDIERSFLESNKVYSSKHSEVYRYAIDGNICAIKIMTSLLPAEGLFLTNYGFHDQNVIQKTFFGVNIEATTFKSVLCTEYIDGLQLHGLLPLSSEESMIVSILCASRTMQQIRCPSICFVNISQKINSCTEAAGDEQTFNVGKIIQQYWDSEIGENHYTQLCLYDLHRDNLILSANGWRIIDVDSVVLGTDSFMFSCLLAASFLLEGYSPHYLLGKTINIFPRHYDRVVAEMIVRLYIGVSFFSNKTEKKQLFKKYVDSLVLLSSFIMERKDLFSGALIFLSICLLRACRPTTNEHI